MTFVDILLLSADGSETEFKGEDTVEKNQNRSFRREERNGYCPKFYAFEL